MSVSPDGSRIAVVGRFDTLITILDAKMGTTLRTLPGMPAYAVRGPDAYTKRSAISFFDAGSLFSCVETKERPHDDLPTHSILNRWGVEAGDLISSDSIKIRRPFTLSRKGGMLIGATVYPVVGALAVHSIPSGDSVRQYPGLVDQAYNLFEISADGSTSVFVDRYALVVDLESGNTIKLEAGDITEVRLSPDGRYLASSVGNNVQIWDVSAGKIVQRLIGHTSSITAITFTLDGRYIATAAEDGSIRTWDPTTGTALYVNRDFTGAVTAMRFHGGRPQLQMVRPFGAGREGTTFKLFLR